MDRAGDILKLSQGQPPDNQSSMQDFLQMSLQSQENSLESQLRAVGLAEWQIVIIQLAQDKRHDLAPCLIPLWKAKLKSFPDEEICSALVNGNWEWFPSVDEVIRQIESNRHARLAEKENNAWLAWKERQRKAMAEGKLASEKDYADLRRVCREAMCASQMRS